MRKKTQMLREESLTRYCIATTHKNVRVVLLDSHSFRSAIKNKIYCKNSTFMLGINPEFIIMY